MKTVRVKIAIEPVGNWELPATEMVVKDAYVSQADRTVILLDVDEQYQLIAEMRLLKKPKPK